MTVPTRPVDAAEIATDWGQEIHDRTFAPSGCEVSGASGNVGTTYSQHVLATIIDDPGGFLDAANNRIEIPTDREGLYTIFVEMQSVNGSAGSGFGTRTQLRINGTAAATSKEDNNGATVVPYNVVWAGVLAAGDQIILLSQRIGSGTNPDVTVQRAFLYRHGAELGA